jgi:hypothetical protein
VDGHLSPGDQENKVTRLTVDDEIEVFDLQADFDLPSTEGGLTSSPIDANERLHRRRIVDESAHNGALSGLAVDSDYEALSDEWVEGRITLDELIVLTRQKYVISRDGE